jgi:hypothetical protein
VPRCGAVARFTRASVRQTRIAYRAGLATHVTVTLVEPVLRFAPYLLVAYFLIPH